MESLLLLNQEAVWAGSTTTVSNQIVAHGLDATASSLVVAEATTILESLTNAPSKLILTTLLGRVL